MTCMCGDTCCPSCGPAQGNSRCILCGSWMSEGCDHVDPDSGDYRPEHAAAVQEAVRRENEAIDAEAEYQAELEALAKSQGWRIF